MKTLKTKRIFVLIWIAIACSLVASIYLVIQDFIIYPNNIPGNWVMLARMITAFILLIMSTNLWQVVKSYTHKSKWQPKFYYKLRQMGFWAIVLTLVSPSFQIIIYYLQFTNHLNSIDSKLNAVFQFGLMIFASSSIMWIFTLSIFLFAELLQIANQIKSENESII